MDSQEKIKNFLTDYAERGRETFAKNNKLGSAYLCCILGMWTNYLNQPRRNPFTNDDFWLQDWFNCGFDAYTQAVGMNYQIRRQMMEAERKKDGKEPPPKPTFEVKKPVVKEKKQRWWNKKLW